MVVIAGERLGLPSIPVLLLHRLVRVERTLSTEVKPTNPKDIISGSKLPVGLVPDTIVAEAALAFLEGATKYGRFNWRIAGVRASVYNDALERHRKKWWNGQDRDPKTRVKNLSSIIACAGILLDAELCGMLTDDRPPRAPIEKLLDAPEIAQHLQFLRELFKDYDPKQYTIADSPHAEVTSPTRPKDKKAKGRARRPR